MIRFSTILPKPTILLCQDFLVVNVPNLVCDDFDAVNSIKRKGGNCAIAFGASKAIESPVESKLDLALDGS
jgi:hypothetical protein